MFNFLLLSFLIFLTRISILSTNTKIVIFQKSAKFFLCQSIFILFFAFTVLNYLLDFYQEIFTITLLDLSGSVFKSFFWLVYTHDKLINLNSISINLIEVYLYPFIYVFLLITVLSIVFCMTYNKDELLNFMSYCQLIIIAGYVLFFTDSLIIFFFAYEMLLIPSFFILYKFAKTRRCVEAAYLMFFWTQFGALFLIFGFLYLFFVLGNSSFVSLTNYTFSSFEVNFLFICFLTGFGVKLPIWPFYGWLPKAHVEASTNFSIFLSGVLVKFAFFGLFKCLLVVELEPTFIYVYPFLILGIVDSVLKLFYQIDLKKLVAYSTVVEMHWLTICVISGQSNLMLASFCMLISHALISTNSFLLVDAIARRFKTRLITEISGLNFMCPKLFLCVLLNILIFLGFPGSIFFVSEILFFSFFLDFFPLGSVFLLFFLYLLGPTFFFRSWMNMMFGFSSRLMKTIPTDLSSRELILFLGVPALMYWLGISWQAFII